MLRWVSTLSCLYLRYRAAAVTAAKLEQQFVRRHTAVQHVNVQLAVAWLLVPDVHAGKHGDSAGGWPKFSLPAC